MAITTGQVGLASDFYRISLEAQKTNAGTFSEETILSGTLPANTLTAGRTIRFKCLFSAMNRQTNGTDGGCTIRMKIGSTTIATVASPISINPSQPATLEGVIRFNGTNAQ